MAYGLIDPKNPLTAMMAPKKPAVPAAAQLQAVGPRTNPAVASGKPPMGVPAPRPNLPTPTQVYGGTPPPTDPAMIGGAMMRPPAPPVPAAPSPSDATPPSPQASNTDAQLAALRKSYLGTFDVSPEEKAAQEKLDAITARQETLRANEQAGEANVAEQAIPFSLIGGQQAALQRQLAARLGQEAAQAVPLTTQLARIQARQAQRQKMTEAELGFAASDQSRADALAKEQAAARKPIEVGGALVDPVTFKPVYTAPEKAQAPIQVSEGNTLYDPATGKAIYTAPKSYKATGGGTGSSSGGGNAGSLSSAAQAVINGTLRLSDLTPTVRGNIAAELNAAGYRQDAQLTSAQQGEIADSNTINGLIDKVLGYNSDNRLEGVGPIAGSLGAAYDTMTGAGTAEAHDVRQLIGNIRGTIAKLRGGTSFTPNEEKLLDSYTPNLTDNQAIVVSKLNNLKSFLATKTGAIQGVAQGQQGQVRQTTGPTAGVTPSGITYTVTQ